MVCGSLAFPSTLSQVDRSKKETRMRTTTITIPELALVAGTRAALGAGVGLLLAGWLRPEQRRAVGWTLLAVGAITTIPLAAEVLGHRDSDSEIRPRRSTSDSSEEEPALSHQMD
jgi:uncharacterized membrane protein YfcA